MARPGTHEVTVALGDDITCTITNDDNAPKLTLNKVVVNDNGGTALESAMDADRDRQPGRPTRPR